jgi:hypothetical protein
MKKYILLGLLMVAGVVQRTSPQGAYTPLTGSQRFLGDVHSLLATGISAADPSSPTAKNLREGLAMLWDLIPDEGAQGRFKAEQSVKFKAKFGIAPDKVDVSKVLTPYRESELKCASAKKVLNAQIRSAQDHVRVLTKDLGSMTDGYHQAEAKFTALQGAVLGAARAQEDLFKELETLRTATALGGEDRETYQASVRKLASDYYAALDEVSEAAGESIPVDVGIINNLIEGLIGEGEVPVKGKPKAPEVVSETIGGHRLIAPPLSNFPTATL